MPTSFTRPTNLPIWDPANPGDIDDPGAKKNTGWQFEDLVPHEWMNWQWNLDYLWFRWIDDVVENSYAEQHDLETGEHLDITATGLEVSGGAFTVDAFGDITCGAIVAAGQITADEFNFGSSGTPEDRAILKRYFIRQDSVFSTSGSPGSLSNNGDGVRIMTLNPTEDGRLIFEVPQGCDLEEMILHIENNASYSIQYVLQRLSLTAGTWGNVTGGPVTDNLAGAGTSITIDFPDTNSPNEAGNGVHIASGQNLLALLVANTDGADDLVIKAFSITYYVSALTQAIQQ